LPVAELAHQSRLADAGLAGDEHPAARRRALDLGQRVEQRAQVIVALQELVLG
jgi:hypothetical protein